MSRPPGALACMATITAVLLLACEPSSAALRTVRVASGLVRPTYLTAPPGDSQRLFVLEQHAGNVRVIKNGTLLATSFLTISGLTTGNEQGLLGLAFHPQYSSNRKLYVYYTTTGGGAAGQSMVVEYQALAGNPDIRDPNVAPRVILHFDQPQANHNAGWIAFGPNDGFLYVASGDGGGSGDADSGHTAGTGNAQDISSNLLGKILRIDVNGDSFPADALLNYSLPASNPFVGSAGDDEIWAYGLRNPWRCSFDRSNGDFYIADVGQGQYEEVNYQAASFAGGANYGWRLMEGNHCYNPSSGCDPGGLTYPVHEYTHALGCSITGGYVYRGAALPEATGLYFFADYCSARIWSCRMVGGVATQLTERTSELAPGGGLNIASIASFGEDALGEVYICDLNGGEVFRIESGNDSDGDGVFDSSDACPNTISGAPVDAQGCPALVRGDFDRDGDVDATDWSHFAGCVTGPEAACASPCCNADFDTDADVDQSDYAVLQRCLSGTNLLANANCSP